MNNLVFTNSEGIVEIKVKGDQTVASVLAMGKEAQHHLSALHAAGQPALLLDDLLEIGNVPPDARKKVVLLGTQLPYDRCALLGKGGLLRIGSNLLLQAMGRGGRIKYFDSREAALKWLHAQI